MSRRCRVIVGAAVLVAMIATSGAASADTLTVEDPAGDVVRYESGVSADEPAVDILAIDVDHDVRRLEVGVTVAEIVPADDERWRDFSYAVQVVLSAEQAGNGSFGESIWFWSLVVDGSSVTGELLSFTDDGFAQCTTGGAIEEARYTLVAERECLEGLPSSVFVGAQVYWDDDVEDDDYDVLFDAAPDDEELAGPVAFGGVAQVTRVAGESRVSTAVELSQDIFEEAQATAAVLASSASHADGVGGAPLAAALGGPLLLTGRDDLDPLVADELLRILSAGAEVRVVGGTAAVSDAVLADVRALGFRATRIAGVDRYETAVLVASALPDRRHVLIADGVDFRAATIAAAAAASLDSVVVLTSGDRLPPSTASFLATAAKRHIAIGTAAATAAPGAEHITGTDHADLSRRVLDRLLPDVSVIGVAGDGAYPDPLLAGSHLGALGGGLLLTPGQQLPTVLRDELAERAGEVREVVIYGGTAAVSEGVQDAIEAALGG